MGVIGRCLLVVTLIVLVTLSLSIPVPGRGGNRNKNKDKEEKDKEDKQKALGYLRRFGYENGRGRTDDERLNQGLKRYQTFHGLPKTGKLDKATRKMMKSPRCGMADFGMLNGEENEEAPSPRYKTLVSLLNDPMYKWQGSKVLPYYVDSSNYPDLPPGVFYYTTALALQAWCSVTDLSFRPVFVRSFSDQPEIEITFSQGYHDCIVGVVFDGVGSVLAHAIWPFYPSPYRCDVHMDGAETWTVGLHYHIEYRTNLVFSLMHELGHVFSILHTDVLDDSLIMYPHLRLIVPTLGTDDRLAIQSMYGGRNLSVPLRQQCGLGLPTEHLDEIDAVMQGHLGEHYLFKGQSVYIMYREISHDYLAFELGNISEVFNNGPESVDAAEYYNDTDTVYLIKGDSVYEYSANVATPGDGKLYQYLSKKSLTDTFGYEGSTPIDFLMSENVDDEEYLVFYKGGEIVWTYPSASSDVLDDLQNEYDVISEKLGDKEITSAFPGSVYSQDGLIEGASYYIATSGDYVRSHGEIKDLAKTKWKGPKGY